MRVLYVSASFDDNIFNKYFDKVNKPQFAASKYHSLLAEGFFLNGVKVDFFSALPITRNNSSRIIIHPKKQYAEYSKTYSLIINIPIIKNTIVAINSFIKTLFSPSDTILVYDCLVISASIGAILASKIRRFKSICIVTDLPVFMDVGKNKGLLSINNKIIESASAFVFLTAAMNDLLNKKHKPHIVVEGHCDIKMSEHVHEPFSNSKVVMYAGSVHRKYGIKMLCDEFLRICKGNEKLVIFGGGDYQIDLKAISENNPNIQYYGTCKNEVVIQKEHEVSILVNPRINDDYTTYSFPSKTMEYMASGTPLLMSSLTGLPQEYKDYLFIFDENKPNDLGNKLREMLDLSNDELELIGSKAKSFIINHKNNQIQAKKIIDWISKEVLT